MKSGLYCGWPGSSATARAAAWANWLQLPTMKWSKVLSVSSRVVGAEALKMLSHHRGAIFKRWLQGGMRYFEARRKYARRTRT